MMKAVVFGSTGYLGSHVTEQLALANHEVTAVVRISSETSFLQSLGVKIVTVDFSNSAELDRVLEGQDTVFNCLADPNLHKPPEAYREVEVKLTQRIAERAAKAGIRKFVQLSTIKVYGSRLPLNHVDETYPCRPEHLFEKACLEREEAIIRTVEQLGLNAVILRPSAAIGKRDPVLTHFARLHHDGKFPMIGGGRARISMVDARDVGRAMVWLGEMNTKAGEIFLLQGFQASWIEIKQELDKLRGNAAKIQNLPVPLGMAVAALLEWITPYTKTPALTRLAVHSITTPATFNDRKIRSTGFIPRYGLHDAVASIN